MSSGTPDRLLFIEEVAEMIRRTPSALRYQIHVNGDVPRSAKVSGRRMFRESDVIEWLNKKFEESA